MNIRTILFLLVAAAVALPLSAQERRPVYIVNGERYEGDAFREIPPAEIERMEQLPADEQTIERYGSDASNGVILITLKYDSKAVFTADSLSFDRYVARRIKWDATDPVARVVYRFKVQCDGSVVLTDLLESTDGRLRRKVVKAVEEAPRWSPATKDGRPVETEHVLRVQLPEGRAMPPERAVILLCMRVGVGDRTCRFGKFSKKNGPAPVRSNSLFRRELDREMLVDAPASAGTAGAFAVRRPDRSLRIGGK